MAHGQVTHIEFPADDVARARRFYEGLLGWEFGEMPGFSDYFMVNLGSGRKDHRAQGGDPRSGMVRRDRRLGRQPGRAVRGAAILIRPCG